MRPAAILTLLVAPFLAGIPDAARAETVGGLAAVHRAGQTFVTWSAPSGSGWTYRVYASERPFASTTDLTAAALLGAVGDSTGCDLRLSRILGAFHGYAIDSAGAPLDSTAGLFVATAAAERSLYYAVTAQAAGGAEDRALIAGANTLFEPVVERPAPPRPVFQRTVVRNGIAIEVYTLWTSSRDTPHFRAMANRPGLAFDCGIVRGAAGGALMIRPHPYGQNFLLVAAGSGEPGEWRLTLDDPIPNADNHTWWFGYGESYDVTSSANPPSAAGTVNDYTFRRVRYTVEWARASFPVDRQRIYASGFSMGGIGSLWLALLEPDLIAAAYAEVPRFDFSSMDDPNLTNLWNEGGGFRRQGDRLWGPVAANLPSSDGLPVYDRLNMRFLAAALESRGMPPIVALCGRNDRVLGWAEKLPFFAEMSRRRHGGYFLWDTRTHTSGGAWDPMRSTRYLYRFRSDRSYPALSRCSADSDPGDGTATSGDSVGAVNAWVEWDTSLTDRSAVWAVTLRLRDLASTHGPFRAPDSLRVDVTPRRLQRFQVLPRISYDYTVTRLEDGAELQSGVLRADATGLLTVPAVTVPRSGCELRIQAGARRVAPESGPVAIRRLEVRGNPVHRSATIECAPPAAGDLELRLVDVTGRLARPLYRGRVAGGRASFRLDSAGLASGVYFVVARQDGWSETQRVVVVN